MAGRNERYYFIIRRITLPKNTVNDAIKYENTIYNLPVTVKIKNEPNLNYKLTEPFSMNLFSLREDDEGGLKNFITEEDVKGDITEENITNTFFTLLLYYHRCIYYLLCSMFIADPRFVL